MNRTSWLSNLPGDLGTRLSRILGNQPAPGEAAPAAGPSPAIPKRPRPASVECLEARQLLSGSIGFAGGVDTTNAPEGGASAHLVVTRTDTSAAEAFNVTASGAGTNPASTGDYSYTSQISFGVGVASATLSISAGNEGVAEPTETLQLVISGSGATNSLTGTCTISDAPLPEVWITSPDSEMAEGGGDATFVIHRDNGGVSGGGTISVNLSFSQPQEMTPDYGMPQLDYSYGVTLGLGPSETERTITLTPNDDTEFEGTESFTVSIQSSSAPADYTVSSNPARLSQCAGTIYDNDQPTLSVTATDDDASEDARDPATFTISRDRSPSSSLNVYFTLSGTANVGTVEGDDADENGIADDESDADYLVEGATYVGDGTWCATIASGESSTDVTVTPLNDALEEDTETVTLGLCETPEVTGGVPAYANPGAAAAGANINNLKVASISHVPDSSLPAPAWLAAQFTSLDSGVWATANAAAAALGSALHDHPSLEATYLAMLPTLTTGGAKRRLNGVLCQNVPGTPSILTINGTYFLGMSFQTPVWIRHVTYSVAIGFPDPLEDQDDPNKISFSTSEYVSGGKDAMTLPAMLKLTPLKSGTVRIMIYFKMEFQQGSWHSTSTAEVPYDLTIA